MRKINIEKLSGKSVEELIKENNSIVEYLNSCFGKNDDDPCFTENYEKEKYKTSYNRYEELQEILKFNDSQKKVIKAYEIRAEINKCRELIFKANNNVCYICGCDLIEILVIHHIHSIAEGGCNDLDNLAVLCPTCHAIVHKLSLEDETHIFAKKLENYFVKPEMEKITDLSYLKTKNREEFLNNLSKLQVIK